MRSGRSAASSWGRSRNNLPRRAKKLVEAGFDVIDINFGCPVKKLLGRCRGGFHLSQPEVAWKLSAGRARPCRPKFR